MILNFLYLNFINSERSFNVFYLSWKPLVTESCFILTFDLGVYGISVNRIPFILI